MEMAGLESVGRCLKRRSVVWAALLVGLVGAVVCLMLLGAAGPAGARVEPSTWAKSYVGDDAMARGVFRLPNGDLIMTGWTAGRPQVTRLSAEGDVRWARRYDWPGTGVHGVPSSDLGPIGIPCSPSGMLVFWGDLLFRLDDDGDVVWARRYRVSEPASSGSIEFTDTVQLPDGGLAVCGHRGYDRVFVCRMDSGGAPLWTRLYELKPSGQPRGGAGRPGIRELVSHLGKSGQSRFGPLRPVGRVQTDAVVEVRSYREDMARHHRYPGFQRHPKQCQCVDALRHLDPEYVTTGRGRDSRAFRELVHDCLGHVIHAFRVGAA